ncbi:MAG: DUF3108 domain-containing protein [Nitrospirae bacterium]|nr:DUF3108 domain-containing protein [Nitrospirota bacterium]
MRVNEQRGDNLKIGIKHYRNVLKNASVVFALLIFAFSTDISIAESFPIPERLEYDLTWGGIKTGEAVLEVKNSGLYIQFISRTNSSGLGSFFYRVEDVVVSTLMKGKLKGFYENFVGVPFNYRIKLREGRHRRDKELIMDHAAKKATYINYRDKEKKDFVINESTLDPLSSFYYIRTLPMEVGKSLFVDVFDSKKLYKAEIKVLKKETIETPAGTFNTILIKPVIKSEGIFYKKGDILIWLTDDRNRIPVLLKTKVAVGSVKATLVGGR